MLIGAFRVIVDKLFLEIFEIILIKNIKSHKKFRKMLEIQFFFGETILLVPEVYLVCAIGPSSLKRAQLVP